MTTVNGTRARTLPTVLETCRAAGVEVPALCFNPRVSCGGNCRSCLVEVNGKVVASCSTPAREGMQIETDTEALQRYRKDLGELMLSEQNLTGKAAEVVRGWGARGDRYAALHSEAAGNSQTPKRDTSHPYLRIDLNNCIKCQLCLRACDEIQGQFVFALAGRGAQTHVHWGYDHFSDSACVACGACAALCPTGAITDIDRERASGLPALKRTQTTCGYCGVGCQLDVGVADDRVVHIDGAASSVNNEHLCVKGRYAHTFSRHPDRLTEPLVRQKGRLVPVSWDTALRTVAERFAELKGSLAALSSSRCTNEENYLVQKWFRAGLGTHNVDCCARVCHAPTATGMRRAFGTGAATNSLADIELADLFLIAGSNTSEAHPVTGARLKQKVLAGTPLIVVDPRKTELAQLAEFHLQLRPGTNVPLLNSLAHVIIEEELTATDFIAARTEGFEQLATFLKDTSPEATEEVTGVSAELVRQAARRYATAERPLQVHGLGMTEHLQGSEAVTLLCNLALLVGAIGREGVGVNPLRGQNNVQGAADMGCQPDSMTGYADPNNNGARALFERVWARPLPTEPGLTLPRMYDAVHAGTLRGMFILGEDVIQTDPNAHHVEHALQKLEFLVVQEIFMSSTAELADVVLPGASFLEKDGTFTNGERRVQRVRRVLPPVAGAKPDWQILCELMAATGYPQPYQHPSEIMTEIGQVAPAFAGASYERLEAQGLQWPIPNLSHPGTPTLHRERFPCGRAKLACVDFIPSPALNQGKDKLLLTTGRVLAHYNTGSMTRRSRNLQLHPQDFLELNPADAAHLLIKDGSRVCIDSEYGRAHACARISNRIATGTAFLSFHFPDTGTNRVTSDVLDRLADCPEYKVTAVTVRPESEKLRRA